MRIDIVVENTKTGFSGYADNYPVYTVGKSLQELYANMIDALNLFFEDKGRVVTVVDLRIRQH